MFIEGGRRAGQGDKLAILYRVFPSQLPMGVPVDRAMTRNKINKDHDIVVDIESSVTRDSLSAV